MPVFRNPTVSDAPAIAALHAKSWQQHYRGALSDDFLDTQVVADRMEVWKERLDHPDPEQYIVIAESEASMVGFACAFFDYSTKFGTLIDNLHVSTESQGLGIGATLMASIAKENVRRYPNMGIYLWVLLQNKKAMQFYANLGGSRLETVEEQGLGDSVVMKCRYVWPSAEILYDNIDKKEP
tara:strand:- start:3842 stop:4387 length:546 start_codon:yes stop_codon:yes gene_type:complete